jgi:hypothetical protein
VWTQYFAWHRKVLDTIMCWNQQYCGPNVFWTFVLLFQFWCSFFLWLDCACQPKSFQKYDEGIPLPLTVSQIKLSEKGIPKFELSYFSCKFNALFYKMIIFMGYWWTIRQMSKIHWVHNIAGSNTLLYPTLFLFHLTLSVKQ